MFVELITFCLIVNKNLSSKAISFTKVIPWLLVQDNLTGDWLVSLLLPNTDHSEFEFGISIFLSVVMNPLSIK